MNNGLESIVAMKPRQDDPKEIAIREKLSQAVLSEQWSQEVFREIGRLQEEYMRDAIAHADDAAYIHDATQSIVRDIASLMRATIISGAEHLASETMHGTPVLVATNHFGAYKLLPLDTRTLGVDIKDYPMMYPPPAYFAALFPVAHTLENNLYYGSNAFPGIFGDMHKATGAVGIPAEAPSGMNKTEQVERLTQEAFARQPKNAMVVFPEGTTSGKPSGEGPYHLEPYKTGTYVIASHLSVPIIHVAQFWHPQEGMRLCVFQPEVPPRFEEVDAYRIYAQEWRTRTQAWLDEQQAALRT